MKIGIPDKDLVSDIDSRIKERVAESIEKLRDAGMTVKQFLFRMLNTEWRYIISSSLLNSLQLHRFDGVKYRFRSEDYTELYQMYANTEERAWPRGKKKDYAWPMLSVDYYEPFYLKAKKIRTLIKKISRKRFKEVDVIITPTTTELPFRFGEKSEPLKMYLSDIFTQM